MAHGRIRVFHFPIVHGWVGEPVSQTLTSLRKLAHEATCSAEGSNLYAFSTK